MKKARTSLLATALATSLLVAAPIAMADDRPNPEERTRIEAALRQMGFVSWSEIEREDGGRVWEVDDARMPDGSKFDLRLAANDLREIERKPD